MLTFPKLIRLKQGNIAYITEIKKGRNTPSTYSIKFYDPNFKNITHLVYQAKVQSICRLNCVYEQDLNAFTLNCYPHRVVEHLIRMVNLTAEELWTPFVYPNDICIISSTGKKNDKGYPQFIVQTFNKQGVTNSKDLFKLHETVKDVRFLFNGGCSYVSFYCLPQNIAKCVYNLTGASPEKYQMVVN